MNELSLWHLTEKHRELLSNLYNYETGEVNEVVQEELNKLIPNEEQKFIAVTKWIKKLEYDMKEVDRFIEEVKSRKNAYEKEIERFQKYLKDNMEKIGIKEISCPYFSIKIKKNPIGTDIIDEEKIPPIFLRAKETVKIDIKPDKNAIKEEFLKTGVQVPGAYVSQKNRIEILTDVI